MVTSKTLLPGTQVYQRSTIRHISGNLGAKVLKQVDLVTGLIIVRESIDEPPQRETPVA